MKKFFVYLTFTISVLSAFGCCKTRSCPTPKHMTPSEKKWNNPYKMELKSHTGELLSDSIRSAVIKAGEKPMNVLVLSGGGQNGAFGAGFLNGLTNGSDPSDLNFDIVTGISTGALQATHAFLGKAYFEKLKPAYTEVTEKDIFRDRNLFDLLCASSFKDTAPLRSMVDELLKAELINKVADAYEQEGRLLYIGTVDLDNGQFVSWNMGEIAGGRKQEAYQIYRDIIMASAAYPVFFPPVPIKQKAPTGEVYESLHTDGGVRENVFFRKFMIDLIEAVKTAIQRTAPGTRIAELNEATMTIIINGKVGLGYDCVQDRLVDVGLRCLSALLDQAEVNAIFRTYALACSNGLSFRMIRIPDDAVIDASSLAFNQKTMRYLYDLGFELARLEPIPWETKPPTGEDLDAFCPEKR